MQFPESMHAPGWRERMPAERRSVDIPIVSRDADAVSPSRRRRQTPALLLLAAVAAAVTALGLDLADDPRPLDVQLSAAMREAGHTLRGWQEQISRGLQVSLLAVADGRETAPAAAPVVAQSAASQAPGTAAGAQ